MVGRRSPCKIEFFRSEPSTDVLRSAGVSGMIDDDGSTLAFISWTRSSLSACGTAHLDLGSANAMTTYFGRLQLRLNLPGAERHSARKRMTKSINRPTMPKVVSVCCAPAIAPVG